MDKTSYLAGILYHLTEDTTVKEVAIQLLNGEITIREAEACPDLHKHLCKAKRQLKEFDSNVLDKRHQAIIDFIEAHLYMYQ